MFFLKLFLLFFLSFLFVFILWKRRRYYLLHYKIGGFLGLPLIGMSYLLINRAKILTTFAKYEQKYGNKYYLGWQGVRPIITIVDPQIAQDIFNSPHCINKGPFYNAIADGTGGGLFTIGEPEWSRQRKLINPAFNHKVLTQFMPIFNKESKRLISILDEHVDKIGFDILEILKIFTLTIATKTTMGHDLYNENGLQDADLVNYYNCVVRTTTEMAFQPWLMLHFMRVLYGMSEKYDNAKRETRAFIKHLIGQKLINKSSTNLAMESENENPNIFINLAMKFIKEGSLGHKEVLDQANILVLAAFETTAITIANILILLAMFPAYQQNLFNEIKSLFPNTGDFEVTMADTQNLVYVDMVINEAMRLMAPVPLVGRVATADVKLSDGVILPAGMHFVIDIFNMQRKVDIWGPDAQKFNPEHFLPSNLSDKHRFAFMPFTKGIRTCIGSRYATLSIKTVLSKLIRNYEFKTTFKFEDLHFVANTTLSLKKMPLLEITRRQK